MIAYLQLLNEALCITSRAESRVIRAKDSEIEQKDGEIAALRAAFRKHEDTLSAIRQTNCEEKSLLELLTHAQQSFTAELEQRRIFEVGQRSCDLCGLACFPEPNAVFPYIAYTLTRTL
jgi:hypothetical protein